MAMHQRGPSLLSQWRNPTVLRIGALTAAILTGLLVFILYSSGPPEIQAIPTTDAGPASSIPYPDDPNPCAVDLDLIRAHVSNTSTVAEYARLEIAVTRTTDFINFSDTLDVPFPPTYQSIDLGDGVTESPSRLPLPEDRCATAVTIQVPEASPLPDASHIVFGVATSVDRLYDSLDALAHWGAGTGARIFAVVADNGGAIRQPTERRAKELGLRLTIVEKLDEERLDRYFQLVRILLQHRDDSTRWAVLIDDDTFFPSMQNLVDRLAGYDASVPQYIGAVTEDMAQMYGSGYIAYGGAGVFLSIPLLQQLDEVYDTCYDFKDTGDRMVARCIYAHTATKLTWDRGLHQLDLREDASGFYESGRRPLPLSLHHWKSWFHANVVALGRVARICGDDCLLRRWALGDGWYLVNGFSVVRYSRALDDLEAMEQTWSESKYKGVEAFGFSLGPLRAKDEGKVSLRLQDAIAEGDRVRQVYVQTAPSEAVPRVLEVVWTLA